MNISDIMKKLTLNSWIIIGLAIVVIILFLILFLRKPVDSNQQVNNYMIEEFKKELVNLNKKLDNQSIKNDQDKIELITYYEQEISKTNKNIVKLYKKLDETLDTIHNLNNDDSFTFFSSWVPKEN